MKLKALAAVCALAVAGQAHALTPAASSTAQVQLFISGSSALQLTLGQIAAGLFNTGSIDVFFDGSGATAGHSYRAYSGTFSAATGALAGKSGVIYETAKGGSIMGIVPVGLSQKVGRIDLTGSSCASAGTTDPITGGNLGDCAKNVKVGSDGGGGGVETALVVGIKGPAGKSPVRASVTANPGATPPAEPIMATVSSIFGPRRSTATFGMSSPFSATNMRTTSGLGPNEL